MSDLLDAVIQAHGGMEAWNKIKSIDLVWNFSGWLLAVKGYPKHYQPSIHIDTRRQFAVLSDIGDENDKKFMFMPERVWIENNSGVMIDERPDPRSSFAGHTRTTPWDGMHLAYFVCYAMYNYLATPFCFAWPGFSTRELETHEERGERWRVLEVTYPSTFATHTRIQKFYFNDACMLQRLDYVTDVAAGTVSHYCFDHKKVGGIVFPMLRRVVRRDLIAGPVLGGPSSFILDYCNLTVHLDDGEAIVCLGAYGDLVHEEED